MIVVGLTGSAGTGKSTVARLFARHRARVLDADRITHALLAKGQPVYKKVRSEYGDEVLTRSGQINRKRLGEIVFKSPRRLRQLTGWIHPAVRRKIRSELARLKRTRPHSVVILDIPLLFESKGAYPTCATVVVSAPFEVVAKRLKKRSGWSAAEVKKRQSFQWPLRKKERHADFVVRNGGSLSSTRRQVDRIWKELVESCSHGPRR